MPIPDSGDVLFVILTAVLLGSALMVVGLRDIIRSGLAMILAFGALAGLYVLLGAPVVAAAQVIVYIGAISILILFAVMLTQAKNAPTQLVFQGRAQRTGAAIAAIILAVVIAVAVTAPGQWGAVSQVIESLTRDIATKLFSDYVLPFEVVSVLLLAAVIGGVYLAKREDRD